MDIQAINQIVAALDVVHSGAQTTPDQRQQAQAVCEKAKEAPEAALYGHYLAHRAQKYPDTVRHFGLSLIENTIRYRWDDPRFNESHHIQIRDAVVQLATEGLHEEPSERHFIKEKVAQLITDLAERLWPQQWPELDEWLQSLYRSSALTQELCLLALRNLADDLGVFDDPLAALRKSDLTNALICVLLSARSLQQAYPSGTKAMNNQYVTVMQARGGDGWLVRWATTMREFRANLVRSDYTLSPASATLLRYHFEALKSNLDLAHLRGLIEINWPTLIVDYLELDGYPEFQKLAVELWVVLSNRHFSDFSDRHEFMAQWLAPDVLTRWATVYQRFHRTDAMDDSDHATVGLRLVQGTVDLAVNHVCHRTNRGAIPEGLAALVDLLFTMGDSPNVLIACQTVTFWLAASKHKVIGPWLRAQVPLPRLLLLCISLVVRCGTVLHTYVTDPDTDPLPEFDGPGALRNYFVGTRLRTLELVQLAVAAAPADALSWLHDQLGPVLAKSPAPTGFDVEQEAALFLTAAVLDAQLTADPATADRVATAQDNLCQRLLEFAPRDEDLALRQLQTFISFSSVFARRHQLLFAFLDKVFSLMLSAEPAYTESPLARASGTAAHRWQAFQVQRKCATTLVRLALAIPDTFLSCYGQVSEAADRVVRDARIPQSNKFHVYDFLLTICFHSSAALTDKLEVSAGLVEPFVARWTALRPYVETSDAFLELLGVPYLAQARTNLDEAAYATMHDRRNDILLPLSVFFALARRTVFPRRRADNVDVAWARYLPVVLPQLLLLLNQIHALWDRQRLAAVDPAFLAVIDLSDLERRTVINNQSLGQLGKTAEAQATAARPPATPFDAAIKALKNWLDTCRETGYELLGYLVSLDACYEVDPGLTHVSELVFNGAVTAISNYHWKQLINFVIVPTCTDSPPAALPNFLPRFLPPLVTFMHDKLGAEWSALIQRGLFLSTPEEQARYAQGDVDPADVTDEIITENILRSLSKAWTDLMVKILTLDYTAREDGAPLQPLTAERPAANVGEFVLGHPALAVALVGELGQLMCLKDSICSLLAVNVAVKMAGLWIAYPHLHHTVGHDLLLAACRAAHDPYHVDNQEVILGLITTLYTTFRPATDAPLQALLQLPGVAPTDTQAFEARFTAAGSAKEKRAVCRMFLQGILGVDRSKWFQKRLSSTSRNMQGSPFNVHRALVPTTSSSVMDNDPHFNLGDIMP